MNALAGFVLAYVLLRHYAYHGWPDAGGAQSWAMYVLTGWAGVLLFCALARVGWRLPGRIGKALVFGSVWAALEELQVAVLGMIEWGSYGQGDLIKRLEGADTLSKLALSLALSAIITGAIYGRRSRAG